MTRPAESLDPADARHIIAAREGKAIDASAGNSSKLSRCSCPPTATRQTTDLAS
jgi:hypothetical protein